MFHRLTDVCCVFFIWAKECVEINLIFVVKNGEKHYLYKRVEYLTLGVCAALQLRENSSRPVDL